MKDKINAYQVCAVRFVLALTATVLCSHTIVSKNTLPTKIRYHAAATKQA